MKATLTREGKLGHVRPYEFVGTRALSRYILESECDVCLTVGLPFRNPTIEDRDMPWYDAVKWVEKYGKSYVFEAWYRDDDDRLHVQALSESDMF